MSNNIEMKPANEYYQTDNNYPQLSNKQQLNLNSDNVDMPNSLLHKEFSQINQNFYKMNVKEIGPTTQDINENIFEEDLSTIIDELGDLYFKETNKGKDENIKEQFVLDYFNNYKINLQEMYNWLINNQIS